VSGQIALADLRGSDERNLRMTRILPTTLTAPTAVPAARPEESDARPALVARCGRVKTEGRSHPLADQTLNLSSG